jgi:hypothetical protein
VVRDVRKPQPAVPQQISLSGDTGLYQTRIQSMSMTDG